jgi:hypothetical protein
MHRRPSHTIQPKECPWEMEVPQYLAYQHRNDEDRNFEQQQ